MLAVVRPPTAQRILFAAVFALCVGVLFITIVYGLAVQQPMRFVQTAAAIVGAVILIATVMAFLSSRMSDYRHPADDADFELLVRRSERLARENLAAEPDETDFMELDPYNPRDFEELVREALDELPDILRSALERNVAVVISDQGRRHRAYGLYMGGTVARNEHDRIVIFRDTLLRDFGHDADELRAQVLRTVRHELAHHLGFDELGVRDLGL